MLTTVFQHLRGEIGFGDLGGMVYLCAIKSRMKGRQLSCGVYEPHKGYRLAAVALF